MKKLNNNSALCTGQQPHEYVFFRQAEEEEVEEEEEEEVVQEEEEDVEENFSHSTPTNVQAPQFTESPTQASPELTTLETHNSELNKEQTEQTENMGDNSLVEAIDSQMQTVVTNGAGDNGVMVPEQDTLNSSALNPNAPEFMSPRLAEPTGLPAPVNNFLQQKELEIRQLEAGDGQVYEIANQLQAGLNIDTSNAATLTTPCSIGESQQVAQASHAQDNLDPTIPCLALSTQDPFRSGDKIFISWTEHPFNFRVSGPF